MIRIPGVTTSTVAFLEGYAQGDFVMTLPESSSVEDPGAKIVQRFLSLPQGDERNRAAEDIVAIITPIAKSVAGRYALSGQRNELTDEFLGWLFEDNARLAKFDSKKGTFRGWCYTVFTRRAFSLGRARKTRRKHERKVAWEVQDIKVSSKPEYENLARGTLDLNYPQAGNDLEDQESRRETAHRDKIRHQLAQSRIDITAIDCQLDEVLVRSMAALPPISRIVVAVGDELTPDLPANVWTTWLDEANLEAPFPPECVLMASDLEAKMKMMAPLLSTTRAALLKRFYRARDKLRTEGFFHEYMQGD